MRPWLLAGCLVSASVAWAAEAIPVARTVDLGAVVARPGDRTPLNFRALAANDREIAVWVERGSSRAPHGNEKLVYRFSQDLEPTGAVTLPLGALLPLSEDFGLDREGNVVFLRTRPSGAPPRGAPNTSWVTAVNTDGDVVSELEVGGLPIALSVGERPVLVDEAGAVLEAGASLIAEIDAPRIPPQAGRMAWLPLAARDAQGRVAIVDTIGAKLTVVAPGQAPMTLPVPGVTAANADGAPLLRGLAVDEDGVLASFLMRGRPSEGYALLRFDLAGEPRATLRLTPVVEDPERGEAGYLLPQDLLVMRDRVMALGSRGKLTVYAIK